MKYKKYIIFAFLILTFTLLGGCAHTVTPLNIYENQMQVSVTLRGTVKMDDTARYFLVLSRYPDFKTPLPFPDNVNGYEFIEPGMQPQLGSMETYYTNFYSSWESYVMMEPAGFILVHGPFVQGTTATREVIGGIPAITNNIQFFFRLNQVFGTSVPDTIYFDFTTVYWPAGGAKYAMDHLNSTNAYISKIAGSTISVDDEISQGMDPSMDITNISVTIQ